MKHYEVSDEYRTGNETIDQQHARMLDQTQRAYQLFTDENMLFKCADINRILEDLSFHTAEHFAYEEEYMREIAGHSGRDAERKREWKKLGKN